jgi:hypothetical protein|tara:strand:+ start:321 stop:515 length:195 start_codon:yes stop_codon:yes gene_type:complete
MQFKELTQGFTFVQEKGGFIEAYDTNGNITGAQPVFISQVSVDNQKDFEVEISYILMDHLTVSN